jgi:hypothetical protein
MASKKSNLVCSLTAALVAVFLMAAPAFAGPGNGKGQDNKAEQNEASAESTSSEDSSPGNSGNAPGKNKKDDKDEESSSSDSSGSQSSDSKDSGPSDNSANSPAPEDSQQGKPAQGCDQADAGYDHNYASTCDGSPSQNGNGGGGANGKPCAGCVGAADNKNPKGQYPDGSDHNNGYECDGNNGIGKGNPAHTSCQPSTSTPPPAPCDADPNMPGTQPCVGGEPPCDADPNMLGTQPCEDDKKITICHATGSMTNPYVIITISINGLNGHGGHEGDIIPAPAGGCPGPDEVLPTDEEPDVREDDAEPDVVLGGQLRQDDTTVAAERQTTEVLGAVLPFTGASILSFLGAALSLIAAGLLALRSRRTS